MGKSLSFSGLEKQFLHEFRNRVILSQDPNELENLFHHMVDKIVNSASLAHMNINVKDFIIDPQHQDGYRMAEPLLAREEFRQIYENSDLRQIIGRFAQPICKRSIHLKRNPKRSDTKIRGN